MKREEKESLNVSDQPVDMLLRRQEVASEESIFPLLTVVQLAELLLVRPLTVKDWVRKKKLKARYQLLSGRSCRMVFTNREVVRFFEENFPSAEDLSDHPCNPRRGSKAVRLIEKMFAMNRLYLRRRKPRTD